MNDEKIYKPLSEWNPRKGDVFEARSGSKITCTHDDHARIDWRAGGWFRRPFRWFDDNCFEVTPVSRAAPMTDEEKIAALRAEYQAAQGRVDGARREREEAQKRFYDALLADAERTLAARGIVKGSKVLVKGAWGEVKMLGFAGVKIDTYGYVKPLFTYVLNDGTVSAQAKAWFCKSIDDISLVEELTK